MPKQEGPRGFEMDDAPGADVDALTFPNLVLSLSASALMNLGIAPHPDEGEGQSAAPPEPNLPMARQTIDILEMLQAKTRGNLEPNEQKLLEQVLHDLHLRYVECRDKQS